MKELVTIRRNTNIIMITTVEYYESTARVRIDKIGVTGTYLDGVIKLFTTKCFSLENHFIISFLVVLVYNPIINV